MTQTMPIPTSRDVLEDVFRRAYGRVLAALVAHYGDLDLAEDALSDALVIALRQWERDGVPRNPAAWLTAIAKRRLVDRLRRRAAGKRADVTLHGDAAVFTADPTDDDSDAGDDPVIADDRLKLMFMCCHPALPLEGQVALTLWALGGLKTAEIARAFLVSETAMTQRLARAKSKIRYANIPYRLPPTELLPERLDAIMAVLYLIFNEGYSASSGDALVRQDLCAEALRLTRVLVELLPDAPISAEPRGLLALMLLHDSRRAARTDADGGIVVLEAQERSRWNLAQILDGVRLLDEAMTHRQPGQYQIQAAISALHAQAATYAETDWDQIAQLYEALLRYRQTDVVRTNHAVAVGLAYTPAAGLRLLLPLAERLAGYYPYHAARADLLRRAGEREAAADAYSRALALCPNAAERAFLARRLAEMGGA